MEEYMAETYNPDMDGDYFRQLRDRDKIKYSQRKLAKFLDLDPSAISLTLNGRRRLQIPEATGWAQFFGVSLQDVLRHAGNCDFGNFLPVPVLGEVFRDGKVIPLSQPGGYVPASPTNGTNLGALECNDSSCLEDGWTYYFNEQAANESVSSDCINRLCLVQIANEKFLGFVKRGRELGHHDVINPFSKERSSNVK